MGLSSRFGSPKFPPPFRSRYSLKIYHKFNELFAWLPLAAIVDDKIFCCHGGISPELGSIDVIRDIRRPSRDIPENSLAYDLLRSDPYEGSGFASNDRGVPGTSPVDFFLEAHFLRTELFSSSIFTRQQPSPPSPNLSLKHLSLRRIFFRISLRLAPAMDLLVMVLRKFGYQGSVDYGLLSTSACIHPPRKETIETFLEVASRPRESNP